MAVRKFKSLWYGGLDSATYGVYITGESVYNAPERSVEIVSVPGRNGDLIIDNGHFENIEVKYRAGLFGSDQQDFAQKISDYKNAMMNYTSANPAKYMPIYDDYNPNEYRLGVFVSGIEVESLEGEQGTVGEFDITFYCKPQRFLYTGVEIKELNSGETITNPTPFESSPLIMMQGGGNITLNGYSISVDNPAYGEITYSGPVFDPGPVVIDLGDGRLNPGDDINIVCAMQTYFERPSGYTITGDTISTSDPDAYVSSTVYYGNRMVQLFSNITIPYTTQTVTVSFSGDINYKDGNNVSGSTSASGTLTFNINTVTGKLTITPSASISSPSFTIVWNKVDLQSVKANSTKTAVGNIYIDTETGECWTENLGEVTYLNGNITMGAELPKLSPGANIVTYDNTVTYFALEGRWWLI